MTSQPHIAYNKPFIVGNELKYIAEAVAGNQISGNGVFTRQCEEFFEQTFGIEKVFMTPSCTAALEMSTMLCGLKPGDEVIMPSFTFVSTASAVVRTGAAPVFVDIREDTLNLDETLVEQAITPRTKAIMPVHYAGVGCEMDRMMELAEQHGLLVLEDAAQGVNARYKDRPLGSIGHLGAYSFHETKNFICGEGGALCVNDPALVKRAEIIHEKGTDRSRFLRGEVDKYTWQEIGSSFPPSEIVCAFLYAQLEALDMITDRRRAIYEFYHEQLMPLQLKGLLRLPVTPPHCAINYHMFYVLLHDQPSRDALLSHLREKGITAVFHYIPLHSSPVGQQVGITNGDLPVTDQASGQILRLPFFFDLTRHDQQHIVDAIFDFIV